jgi:hypothetical protein
MNEPDDEWVDIWGVLKLLTGFLLGTAIVAFAYILVIAAWGP